MGNHRVELFGDDALAETYVTAVHWTAEGGFTTGARYVDHLTFRDGRWAIAERWAVRSGCDRGRRAEGRRRPGPAARRDGTDPVQLLRERLRANTL